jgi:hypothetical protein
MDMAALQAENRRLIRAIRACLARLGYCPVCRVKAEPFEVLAPHEHAPTCPLYRARETPK